MSLTYTVSMKDRVSIFETTFFFCLFVLSYCVSWSFAFNSLRTGQEAGVAWSYTVFSMCSTPRGVRYKHSLFPVWLSQGPWICAIELAVLCLQFPGIWQTQSWKEEEYQWLNHGEGEQPGRKEQLAHAGLTSERCGGRHVQAQSNHTKYTGLYREHTPFVACSLPPFLIL